ncbi:composite domain of metallo-dependent hydrolase [Epithele typhae]|uniref:composite domain of metallo-dependent hydrolase n=1 Tax=Epithele typhae TaxID=378194 RepID=UPI002007CDD2|nr:composite domain of metallo-dependent hydrolase [Epithele typhae]KAH9913692.1 composite domain of metallo-dependent hydrolase [Epithele typhae]
MRDDSLEKVALPSYAPGVQTRANTSRGKLSRGLRVVLAGTLSLVALQSLGLSTQLWREETITVPLRAQEWLRTCELLDVPPGPPPDFHDRALSDRFVDGTMPTFIMNATIWTGGDNGMEVLKGDLILDGGLISRIWPGGADSHVLDRYNNLAFIDAQGKWVSPGIVDLHSHMGVDSSPSLKGGSDTNSRKGPVLPWLRALDGLNTRDDAMMLSISGGLTTVLVLPGSANAIGGQGAVIKLRHTADRAPTGMLLESPYEKNTTIYDPSKYFRYRQMKHACGENPDRVYSGTRMDTAWAFRQAYDHARQLKEKQDAFCSKARKGQWDGLGEYPEDLQWEALVDVLRGRVKVQTHCYETVDLDDLVRITNEFKFSIAAFHHAHETYLVPDTLKSAYGKPPGVALFANHARYKRESYRGSEFAPRVLADNGLQVVMKSDHPVLNSRHLLYEAQQAHYYGLPHNLALAAVTSTPATIMGQNHRIGYVKEGYDADIVLWDSHPLALGATPQQVWIDGIPQLDAPFVVSKPASLQDVPPTPNFDKEMKETLKYDGLPPLEPKPSLKRTVVFTNVSSVHLRDAHGVKAVASASANSALSHIVVVRDGKVACVDVHSPRACRAHLDDDTEHIDLSSGAIAPGLTSAGSALGVQEIDQEMSTQDGYVFDPLTGSVPAIAGGSGVLMRAADGLQFGTRDALLAYRSGVTAGIVAPLTRGFVSGLNTMFSTGARHKLEEGAVVQPVGAVHVALHPGKSASVSTQVAALRNLLLGDTTGEMGKAFAKVKMGKLPLVVEVSSADIIASVIGLKADAEEALGNPIRVTLFGATEAHLLAKELAAANIGVVLAPVRPFPSSWEERRILPGPPLSEQSSLSLLLAHGVKVGMGTTDKADARNARFDVAWASLESGGKISALDAFSLATSNVEELLGVASDGEGDLVATAGGDLLSFSSKVVAVISPRRGVVDIM